MSEKTTARTHAQVLGTLVLGLLEANSADPGDAFLAILPIVVMARARWAMFDPAEYPEAVLEACRVARAAIDASLANSIDSPKRPRRNRP